MKLVKYNSSTGPVDFIKRDISKSGNRVISIRFTVKTIGGYHHLYFIAKRYNSTEWIHKANFSFKINDSVWKEYENQIRISANMDFVVDIDDREIENSYSAIQIKNLKIGEII